MDIAATIDAGDGNVPFMQVTLATTFLAAVAMIQFLVGGWMTG